MPNTREKLAELIFGSLCRHIHKSCKLAENIADDLMADGVTVQEWISVKDRLPDKHDRYLCSVKAFSFPDLRYFAILKYDDGGFIEGKIYTDDVTHWMPLPPAPEEEK